MLSLANELVSRATRFIRTAQDEPALWAITVHGRIAGSLVCRGGAWRLADYAGPVDGHVEALAEALSARLGTPVRLESLSA